MPKHVVQFAVMVRPTLFAPEVMVGMPYADEDTAEFVADELFMAGNYRVEVVPYNPITGEETAATDYNDFPPLS